MSTTSILYPESFQKLLASAQESGIKTLTLSAIVELQRLFASGRLDADGTMHLIAEGARRVANASGVAIGLLEGDQLAYRAGSGSAAACVGQPVMSALADFARGASHDEVDGEILRVENGETGAQVQLRDEICRQLVAKSVLILPISKDGALAGVLQVHFSEAHAFQSREVRTYQLMSGLIGETIAHRARPVRLVQREAVLARPVSARPRHQRIRFRAAEYMTRVRSGALRASIARAGQLPLFRQLAGAASLSARRMERALLNELRWHARQWKKGLAVAMLLVVAIWIVQRDRGPATAFGASVPPESSVIERPASRVSAILGLENGASVPQSATVPVVETAKAKTETGTETKTKPQWVRVGNDEIDYVTPDVTVRRFIPKPPAPSRSGERHVVHIGDDVTVRYFKPKQTVGPQPPVSR